MAEREGFEPSVALLRLHSLSRRAPSANSAISPRSARHAETLFLAEGVGFEPTVPRGTAVFKTAALNHSAIPP